MIINNQKIDHTFGRREFGTSGWNCTSTKVVKTLCLTMSVIAMEFHVSAQSIEKAVIVTSGNTISNNNVSMTYTVGQPTTEMRTSENLAVTGQYQQTEVGKMVAGLLDKKDISSQLAAYPNPVSKILNLYLNSKEVNEYKVDMYNTNGEIVKTGKWLSDKTPLLLDLSGIAMGTYYIKVFSERNQEFGLLKVVKVKEP